MHKNFAEYVASTRSGWVIQDDGEGPYIKVQGSGDMPTDAEIDAWLVERQFSNLRTERDARLRATDKYTLSDFPISAEDLERVLMYRAALRALPEQPGAPWPGGDIPWPVMPQI